MHPIHLCATLITALYAIPAHAFDSDLNIALLAKAERSNNGDRVLSTGFRVLDPINRTPFAFGFSTALGAANVTTMNANKENFVTLDTSVQFGYFSDIYTYAEVGFDMFELVFSDQRDDGHRSQSRSLSDSDSNDIDAFAGVAVGVKFHQFNIEAYTRYRQINSSHWKAENTHFSGVQVSLSF